MALLLRFTLPLEVPDCLLQVRRKSTIDADRRPGKTANKRKKNGGSQAHKNALHNTKAPLRGRSSVLEKGRRWWWKLFQAMLQLVARNVFVIYFESIIIIRLQDINSTPQSNNQCFLTMRCTPSPMLSSVLWTRESSAAFLQEIVSENVSISSSLLHPTVPVGCVNSCGRCCCWIDDRATPERLNKNIDLWSQSNIFLLFFVLTDSSAELFCRLHPNN